MVKASIITIGDELLIGQVIDTNSAWIATELNRIGIPVIRRVAVGDIWDDIWSAIDEEKEHADLIFMTGGLGPTADDITKPLLCKYFGGNMIINQGVLDHVRHRFEVVLKRPMGERNEKQAEVPDICEVVRNELGTAPGMWFIFGSKSLISMPGVPHEMKHMMQQFILPRLSGLSSNTIQHRTLLLVGVGESTVADLLNDFERELPASIKLAYLPNLVQLRLRLTAQDSLKEGELDFHFDKLKNLVKEFMVTDRDEPLEQVIANMLSGNGLKLATAESCTGGYISHTITSIPGSSKYFQGGLVTYANEFKQNLLGVSIETLKNYGAVSAEVVIEMATGVLEKLHSDYSIAVSGIMGPGGGTEAKPVGTVWIAVANKHSVQTKKFQPRYDRQHNIQTTTVIALNMLRKMILEDNYQTEHRHMPIK